VFRESKCADPGAGNFTSLDMERRADSEERSEEVNARFQEKGHHGSWGRGSKARRRGASNRFGVKKKKKVTRLGPPPGKKIREPGPKRGSSHKGQGCCCWLVGYGRGGSIL